MDKKPKIPLTAHQIKIIDDNAAEKIAIDRTFKNACTYHSNRIEENEKVKRTFWEDILTNNNLDFDKTYTLHRIDGIVYVILREDK